jgi:hypothetical protein
MSIVRDRRRPPVAVSSRGDDCDSERALRRVPVAVESPAIPASSRTALPRRRDSTDCTSVRTDTRARALFEASTPSTSSSSTSPTRGEWCPEGWPAVTAARADCTRRGAAPAARGVADVCTERAVAADAAVVVDARDTGASHRCTTMPLLRAPGDVDASTHAPTPLAVAGAAAGTGGGRAASARAARCAACMSAAASDSCRFSRESTRERRFLAARPPPSSSPSPSSSDSHAGSWCHRDAPPKSLAPRPVAGPLRASHSAARRRSDACVTRGHRSTCRRMRSSMNTVRAVLYSMRSRRVDSHPRVSSTLTRRRTCRSHRSSLRRRYRWLASCCRCTRRMTRPSMKTFFRARRRCSAAALASICAAPQPACGQCATLADSEQR